MRHSKRVSLFVQIMFTGLASTLQCIKILYKRQVNGKVMSKHRKVFFQLIVITLLGDKNIWQYLANVYIIE